MWGPESPGNIFGGEKEKHKLPRVSKQITWTHSCPLGVSSCPSPHLGEEPKE